MIYLNNTTAPQLFVVPMTAWNGYDLLAVDNSEGAFTLKAVFDNKEVEIIWEPFPPQIASGSDFGNYIAFYIALPEGVASGSYELKLTITSPEQLVGQQTYVVQVGEYEPQVTDYEKTIEYEQY